MSNCLLKWMVWVSEFCYTLPKEYEEKNVLVEVRNEMELCVKPVIR